MHSGSNIPIQLKVDFLPASSHLIQFHQDLAEVRQSEFFFKARNNCPKIAVVKNAIMFSFK